MLEIIHNKLVRDNIPEIIIKDGNTPKYRSLGFEDYRKELLLKLKEEVDEFLESNEIEELTDILEVVDAIAEMMGYSQEDITQIKTKKKNTNGGFSNKVFLEKVLKNENTININLIIEEYISVVVSENDVEGCLICGSYINGGYNHKSDIDILFLVKNASFEMILENYKGKMFDKMIVDPNILNAILSDETPLSDILSLSFGSKQKIIIDSEYINNIILHAKENINKRSLVYLKDQNKPDKIVDGKIFTLVKNESGFKLVKDGKIVL